MKVHFEVVDEVADELLHDTTSESLLYFFHVDPCVIMASCQPSHSRGSLHSVESLQTQTVWSTPCIVGFHASQTPDFKDNQLINSVIHTHNISIKIHRTYITLIKPFYVHSWHIDSINLFHIFSSAHCSEGAYSWDMFWHQPKRWCQSPWELLMPSQLPLGAFPGIHQIIPHNISTWYRLGFFSWCYTSSRKCCDVDDAVDWCKLMVCNVFEVACGSCLYMGHINHVCLVGWRLLISRGPSYLRLPENPPYMSGLILGLRLANERWRYFVTTSPVGWAQTQNQPCMSHSVILMAQWKTVVSPLLMQRRYHSLAKSNIDLNQTCFLIGWQHSCQPIRSHVRNPLLTNKDFDRIILEVIQAPDWQFVVCSWITNTSIFGHYISYNDIPWWRHQMETFSA